MRQDKIENETRQDFDRISNKYVVQSISLFCLYYFYLFYVLYFLDYKLLRSISRTNQKMHNEKEKNIYKSHRTISHSFWGNVFYKIRDQELIFYHERQVITTEQRTTD
ncbi:hypothetical protein NL108_006797 [Boleophthalmus pectinirostris]|nr:hypothetical protein NL108_006797 [Boleophthalmus pectinirostris]